MERYQNFEAILPTKFNLYLTIERNNTEEIDDIKNNLSWVRRGIITQLI